MAAVFGDDIQPSTDFEIAFDDSFVDRLDGLDLRFETASAELDDEDRESLDQVADLMADNENLIIRINGHTDGTGEDAENKNLSRDRADAAYEYLLAARADKDRLTANARGASDPKVDPEQSEADRATNRRVSFIIPRG
jgi:outer membrane protein OmpA-like peptidoglycan-associated protein